MNVHTLLYVCTYTLYKASGLCTVRGLLAVASVARVAIGTIATLVHKDSTGPCVQVIDCYCGLHCTLVQCPTGTVQLVQCTMI